MASANRAGYKKRSGFKASWDPLGSYPVRTRVVVDAAGANRPSLFRGLGMRWGILLKFDQPQQSYESDQEVNVRQRDHGGAIIRTSGP